jgi:CRISPR system Cascade subunit CasC
VPKEIRENVKRALKGARDGGQAADVALFGRMIADLPAGHVDGACQVAHALSVNKLNLEDDFFTAVEELKGEDDDPGAAMMDVAPFTSACYYRYANIDTVELMRNLDGEAELARDTLEAFLRASVWAVPSGKQHSTAPHNPPSLIFAVVRDGYLWSLANAFLQPVRPIPGGDLVDASITAMDEYWGELLDMYPEAVPAKLWVTTGRSGLLSRLKGAWVPNLDVVIEQVLSTVFETTERSA